MADKFKEKKCFDMVLKCRSIKGQFAYDVYHILSRHKDRADYNGERPDIVIDIDNEIIGIEHCQVDMLFKTKRKKAQSVIGMQKSNGERLVEKYKDKELLDKDIQNGEALKSVLDMVEERMATRNDFKYPLFVENLNRICLEHNNNCKAYIERLNMIAAGRNICLACLVEIPYIKEKLYVITDSKGTRRQAIKGLPITEDILSVIQKMNGFDIVILCMYCIDNTKDVICYYFCPSDVKEGVKQQNIKPVKSFDLIEKPDITFPKDKYEIKDGEITFYAKATFGKKDR